ncbi:DUF2065 family protein [Planctomycetota bacterium]
MNLAIKIIGGCIAFMGILYLIKPDIMKKVIEFFKKGKRVYLAAILRFALAITFLVGATQCRIPWGIIAFGIVFIISGLLIFMLRAEKIKGILDWYSKQPNLILRFLGLIVSAIGLLILYFA